MRLSLCLAILSLLTMPLAAQSPAAQTTPMTAVDESAKPLPWEWGVQIEGGNGLTDNRNGFHFLNAGVHAGKTLTPVEGHGIFRGSFEYGMEILPYWQAFTPKFQRVSCNNPNPAGSQNPVSFNCGNPYTVGGTATGVSVTPIILRWNFAGGGKRFKPFAQAAGGLVWTNHKFPAYGSTTANYIMNGPNGDTSVFNFTPQGGIGVHYFVHPRRSIDFIASGEHISSASLGDRNPGVNASVQFSLGYTWWK